MTREVPLAAGIGRPAKMSVGAESGVRVTARLVVTVVVLFVVLAGIWACLWVPPARGF
jgi:hypothetical protein